MRMANPLWGAPRIHGELLKVGIDLGNFAAIRNPLEILRYPPCLGSLSAS
jgi:hypothetical protein